MEQIGNVCFWLGLVIEAVLVMIDKSEYINPYEGWLFRIAFLLFCVKIATTRYSKKEWLCMIFIGSIAVISYLVNEKDEAVRAVTLIAACKDVSLKRMLKTVLAITAVGSLLLLVLSLLGIFGELTMTANFGRGPFPGIVETRYCFGMGHPNAFQTMILMMTILLIYIYAEQMKWYHYLFVLLGNYVSFHFTDSNTGFLVAIAIIVGVMLLKYVRQIREAKIIYMIAGCLVFAIVIFSAIGAHTGRYTPLMWKIDAILNGRFQYAYEIENARLENWKLFADTTNTEYFDSGFIKLFYWYGIIPGVFYVLTNLYLIYQSYKKGDYPLVVMIVGLSVFMIMEAHVISFYILRNYIFIWLGYYWYQDIQEGKEFGILDVTQLWRKRA